MMCSRDILNSLFVVVVESGGKRRDVLSHGPARRGGAVAEGLLQIDGVAVQALQLMWSDSDTWSCELR